MHGAVEFFPNLSILVFPVHLTGFSNFTQLPTKAFVFVFIFILGSYLQIGHIENKEEPGRENSHCLSPNARPHVCAESIQPSLKRGLKDVEMKTHRFFRGFEGSKGFLIGRTWLTGIYPERPSNLELIRKLRERGTT